MDNAVPPTAGVAPRHGRTIGRILSAAVLIIVALAALAFGTVKWLDTDSGRAFIVRQLPLYAPQSGLQVRAGRIDGSIFGQAVINDLTLADPKGVFARVDHLDIDWRPLDLVDNLFSAHDLHAAELRVLRMPELRPSADTRIMPDIDIVIDRLKIDRLVLEPPVSGALRVIGVDGKADLRKGRALIDIAALTLGGGGGDAIKVRLDSQPDRDKFDLDADVTGPKGGVIDGMLKLGQPLDLSIKGKGSWTVWAGALTGRLGDAPLADLVLHAEQGRFSMTGTAAPARLLTGAGARLLGPVLKLNGSAEVHERAALLDVHIASRALTADANGRVDFGKETLNDVTVAARLLDPAALHPRITGHDVRLAARLAGTFKQPLVDYRLSAADAAWGHTGVTNLRAAGIVRAGDRPLVIPVSASATTVSGVGITGAELLKNVRLDGPLTFAGGKIVSNAINIRSDRLSGRGTLLAVLGEDNFLVTVSGRLPNYLLPGLGLADVTADVRAVPAPGGARVTGKAVAKITRLDNGFFRKLLEGLPSVTGDIDVAGDTSLTFRNARLTSPGLSLIASGTRNPDGFVKLSGQGVSRVYGPLTLALAGQIEAPTVDLVLAKPGLGVGLAEVAGRVAPVTGGWSFDAHGVSSFGPAAAKGLIRTASDPLTIDLATVSIAGQTGHGTIAQTAAGPFTGRIDFTGKGLTGQAVLVAAGAVQRVDVALKAHDAPLPLATPVMIGSGSVTATILLPDAGPGVTGSFDLAGIDRDGTRIERTQGKIDYRDGRGAAQFTANGQTSVPFALTASAAFAPDRIEVKASGKYDGKPVSLSPAAVLMRGSNGDWHLAPVTLTTADGQAVVSGAFGETRALNAQLKSVNLSLLAGIIPGLDIGGRVSGTVDMSQVPGALPAGTANLRINGLTRAGVASASTPIDLGINVALGASGGEARAVIVRGGVVEGRAQARVGPVPGGNGMMARFLSAPLFAQLRYNGPAQAVWGLAGIEALDVRGPIQIAADAGGKLGDPTLSGTITAKGARVENTTLGAVVDQASLDARFTQSRLELTQFSGNAGKGGTVTGSGTIGLSADAGFPIDIRMDLKDAQLLNRDDLTAAATGSVRLATDQFGGVVSGKLAVDKATFRIGRNSSADVPVLDVTEKNTAVLGRRQAVYVKPTRWLLNVTADADRRLFVSGLGLEAEWRGHLVIKGGATTPEISGRVQVVRGDYEFAGKRFDLTRGDIRFMGNYPPDPIIDIVAENSSTSLTAQLAITGTGQHPDIKFSSIPSLPEDEVLSRVLFGDSVNNLSAPEALQLAAALNGLRGGGGFNPINSVRKGLGIDRLRILSADPTIGRKTAVAAGQYIGKHVYVELATDAQGYSATNIELSLTRSLSILSQVATLGGTSVSVKWKKDY